MKPPSNQLAGLDILIVEDDPLLRNQIKAYLEELSADVIGAKDIQSTKTILQKLDFDFVLLDVNLPDGLGTDLLKEKMFPPSASVIVITAGGGVSGAVEAVHLGAADYLVKPFDIRELPIVLGRARRFKQAARLDEHRRTANAGQRVEFFFGSSLQSLRSQLDKILASDVRLGSGLPPVLIQGETGTGKSTIAHWIHDQGPRAGQPLVELNCSALPELLAESELFGHERGAFTDARSARMGLFEAANGGTLFLDEIASLAMPLQAKLLTTLEDKVIRRIGGNKAIPVDVRIIAAANRDLKSLVAASQFREDLFHRLDLFRLNIPPLRERGQEIISLANRLLEHLCQRYRTARKKIHPDAERRLLHYTWPGNVRELAHELERAIVFEESEELKLPHLPNDGGGSIEIAFQCHPWFDESFEFPAQFSIEDAVYQTILHALKRTNNNVSAAARLLGVPRDYVRYRLATARVT